MEKNDLAAKPRFETALQHCMESDRNLRDWCESRVERFGRQAIPTVERVVREVREDLAEIDSWESAWLKLFGESLDDAARERWIREAAYFHAEKRGFEGGCAADDWVQAEREFDHRHQGVIGRGCARLWSLAERIGRELDGICHSAAHGFAQVSASVDRRII